MLSLAIIPSLFLLFFIYKKDKREKEPLKKLFGCFLFGVIIIVPILIMETVTELIFENFTTEGSIAYAIVDGFIVAALAEELFKYLALKKRTWKSPDFNCTFDGIVYSVFVSLGFATFENIMYVMDGGLSTAILRMFTSVPGHACDAVYMGYFYSLAKKFSLAGDKKSEKKYKRLALFVPIMLHGLYDCLISFEESVVGEAVVMLGILLWITFIVALFIVTFLLVNKASKNDVYLPAYENPSFALKAGAWICNKCRSINNGNFCPHCGSPKS